MKTTFFLTFLICFFALIIAFSGCSGNKKEKEQTPLEQIYSSKFSYDSISTYLIKELSLQKDTIGYFPDSIKYYEVLKMYYSERKFQPILINQNLNNPDIDSILKQLINSELHGLLRSFYRLNDIIELLDSSKNSFIENEIINYQLLARADIVISNSLLEYSGDLQYGRIHPALLWKTHHGMKMKTRDSTTFFNPLKAISKSDYLKSIQPNGRDYKKLQNTLKYYLKIKESGGWDSLFLKVEKIEFGTKTSFADSLAKRLLQTYDIDSLILSKIPMEGYNDSILFKALKNYQSKNGLLNDGVIGKHTINSLNISVDDRIKKISANLERFRWFEYPDTGIYIKVNLPEFMLYLQDKGKTRLTMKICCGEVREKKYDEKMKTYLKTKKKYHKPNNHETPTMFSKISYFVLNPEWIVPKNITDNEIIYKALKDSNYIENNNYCIFDGDEQIDPKTIDWKYYADKRLPYKIKQSSGDGNALGKIKFMFDNKHSIYLHDTPNKAAFNRAYRAVSHGCVRIQKPLELAEILIEDHKRWDFDAIRMELGMKPIDDEDKIKYKKKLKKFEERMEKMAEEGGKLETKSVYLEKGVPLYIDYYTCWVDSAGIIQFRQDIYNRDKDLIRALFK
ncbi:MAG: L,D-transpeptidase family protein [Bacteroidales bacterium]|nr:L,D-transpeptidase family protein [Bacteroidales bacterium]